MYGWSKVNIWNVHCAQATTFIFDTRTNVLAKLLTDVLIPCFFGIYLFIKCVIRLMIILVDPVDTIVDTIPLCGIIQLRTEQHITTDIATLRKGNPGSVNEYFILNNLVIVWYNEYKRGGYISKNRCLLSCRVSRIKRKICRSIAFRPVLCFVSCLSCAG